MKAKNYFISLLRLWFKKNTLLIENKITKYKNCKN